MNTVAQSCSLALLLVAGARPVAQEERAPHVLVTRDGTRVLRADDERIAVWRSAPSAIPLAALGVTHDDVEEHAIAGWALVRVAPIERATGIDAAHGLRALVERAALERDVDFVSPVFVDDLGGPLIVTPRILAAFEDRVSAATIDAWVTAASGTVVERDWARMPGAVLVESRVRSGFAVLDAANDLAPRPGVRFAEPDFVFSGASGGLVLDAVFPNDPGFPNCWGLYNTGQFGGVAGQDMRAPAAWGITSGDAGVLVVVIDTGIQQNHPDIHQAPGADFTGSGGSGGPMNSFDNHGTAVAGCLSAVMGNGVGTVGIAPGVRAVSARTFVAVNSAGNWNSTASWTVNALAWAESIGCRVSNNSNTYGFTSSAIAAKYASTRDGGMVHFAASGNDGSSSAIAYPASLPTVMAIGALSQNGLKASFSNGGAGLFATAPGNQIYTTDRTGSAGYASGNYAWVQGTSYATPYAAGIAALVLSRNPTLSAQGVESILASTARDKGAVGYDTSYGYGFLDAHAALLATPSAAPVVTALDPTSIPAVNVDDASFVTLEGSHLASVDSITVDGVQVSDFVAVGDGELRMLAPRLEKLGPVDVVLTSPYGSATATLFVEPNDPPVVDLATVGSFLIVPQGIRVTVGAAPGTWMLLFVSPSAEPSLLPGFIELGIGNHFLSLVHLATFPVDAVKGWNEFAFHPAALPIGMTLHFQAASVGLALPLQPTNVQSGTVLH